MSEKIVQLNEEVIKGQLKKLVRHISRNWYETAWREPLCRLPAQTDTCAIFDGQPKT